VCDKVINVLPDVLLTLALVLTDLIKNRHFPFEDEIVNHFDREFLEKSMGIEFKPTADPNYIVDLDPSFIKDGDAFFLTGFDGIDLIIIYSTGGFASHCAIAMWDEDELYVLESTDPVIRKTPYKQWVEENF